MGPDFWLVRGGSLLNQSIDLRIRGLIYFPEFDYTDDNNRHRIRRITTDTEEAKGWSYEEPYFTQLIIKGISK